MINSRLHFIIHIIIFASFSRLSFTHKLVHRDSQQYRHTDMAYLRLFESWIGQVLNERTIDEICEWCLCIGTHFGLIRLSRVGKATKIADNLKLLPSHLIIFNYVRSENILAPSFGGRQTDANPKPETRS